MPPSLNRMLFLMSLTSKGRCRNKSLKAGKRSSVSRRTQRSGRAKGAGDSARSITWKQQVLELHLLNHF